MQADVRKVIDRYVDSIEKKLELASKERGQDFIVEDQEYQCHRFALDMVFTTFYKQDNMINHLAEKDSWTDLIGSSLSGVVNLYPILK